MVFDDYRARIQDGWIVCDESEWSRRAGPASTGDGIAMVLSERTENNSKLPCAFLKQPLACTAESPWLAYGDYEPAPKDSSPRSPTDWALAPVAFPFGQGTALRCSQPFVSIPKGKTTVEPSTEPAVLHVCGVLIGNEYNTSKRRTEQRRWVAGVYELGAENEEEVMAPLSAIIGPAGLPVSIDTVRAAFI